MTVALLVLNDDGIHLPISEIAGSRAIVLRGKSKGNSIAEKVYVGVTERQSLCHVRLRAAARKKQVPPLRSLCFAPVGMTGLCRVLSDSRC
jgi:hypothetical protein